MPLAAALVSLLTAGLINKDSPHGLHGGGENAAPVLWGSTAHPPVCDAPGTYVFE